MDRKLVRDLLGVIALFLSLASCGPAPQVGGGIGGTGQIATIASGQITGFGSVFVSGYEYDTTRTSMMVDGKPGSQSDLKKGMIVRINATVNEEYDINKELQRTANTLLYEDTVDGMVQSVASDGSSLDVLGQMIRISTKTVVDDSIPGHDVRRLVPGRDLVRISGFVTGDGVISGTFIGLKTLDIKVENSDDEVKGFIKNHRAEQQTFEIGALTVDYRDAVLNDMPGQSSDIWDGLLVDVVGKQVLSKDSGASGMRLAASLVWPEGLGTEDSADVKVEGFVTRVLGPGDFFIGNLHVLTSSDTSFEGGTVHDILVGIHLEVHGPLVGGTVRATKVELEEADLKGSVTQVLGQGDFFVGNLHVRTHGDTSFEGGTLNDILIGAYVEVYGPLVDGILNATKLEFEREVTVSTQESAIASGSRVLP